MLDEKALTRNQRSLFSSIIFVHISPTHWWTQTCEKKLENKQETRRTAHQYRLVFSVRGNTMSIQF